jgi:hypothetical protein
MDLYNFGIVLAFAIGAVVFVSIQTITILFLTKWNNELKKQVEYLKPPF